MTCSTEVSIIRVGFEMAVELNWHTDSRIVEPFRPTMKNKLTTITLKVNIGTFRESIGIDYLSFIPIIPTIRFLRARHVSLAAISLLPIVGEIWTVVFATSLAGIANHNELGNTRTLEEVAFTNVWWPLILLGSLLPGVAFSYIYGIRLPQSAVNYVLPRQPSTLASMMSYIHSSKTLLADAMARPSSPNKHRYLLAWYRTESGALQLRFDVEEECEARYWPGVWQGNSHVWIQKGLLQTQSPSVWECNFGTSPPVPPEP